MLLTLFVLLLAIGFLLLGIGYAVDVPAYSLTGLAFIFLLSGFFIAGTVEYRTGETATVSGSMTSTVYTYESFTGATSKTIGIYLAVASALGFTIVLADMRNPRGMKG